MTELRLHLFQGGACTHREHMVLRTAAHRTVSFPSLFALLEHPREGLILYDTGYAPHFFNATRFFPERFYRLLTPVTLSSTETALARLQQMGYRGEDLRWLLISHFHGDHVAGLRDFPQARYVFLQAGYEHVRRLRGFKAVRIGFLPQLLPGDFESRALALDVENPAQTGLGTRVAELPPFDYVLDLFGDGSIQLVPLQGHFCGQMGALLKTDRGPVLLAADACWYRESFEKMILPHPLAMAIMYDAEQYQRDLQALHNYQLAHPEVAIIPSHCSHSLQRFEGK